MTSNGEAALELWKKNQYSLVLTDINMPVMDGFEFSRAIRESEGSAAHVPIIALTASISEDGKAAGREIGINKFIEKPLHIESLEQLLSFHTQELVDIQSKGLCFDEQSMTHPGRGCNKYFYSKGDCRK